jgi:hypothetical protein
MRNSRGQAADRGPQRGGGFPRLLRSRSSLVALAAATLVAACSGNGDNQVTRPVPLGMSTSLTAFYDDGQLTLYQVARPVPLPVRKPTSAESSALGPAPKGTPYPHAPFLRSQDESVEVHYTLSNLDDGTHTVWMLIDPWNEFVRWNPGVQVVSDDETVPNFGYDISFVVPGKSRVQGTVTSDDMHEIAVKLASVENVISQADAIDTAAMNGGGATTNELVNHIFNPQNRSNTADPLYSPWIPPVIAGVTGFDLGLRTMEPANVAIEITMDVVDMNGNRFVFQDSTDKEIGIPSKVLSPPGARF